MRRADREVKDFDDIIGILDRCDTIRIGIFGDEYPYVVPVSFGYEVVDGNLFVYFHGAKEGLKHELLAKNGKVCIEADILHRYAETGHSVTAEYESIIGYGTAAVACGEEAEKGISLLLAHCGYDNYSAHDCYAGGMTWVYRIAVASLTGKRREVRR